MVSLDRLLFLPVALALAWMAFSLDLTYLGIGVLAGTAIPVFDWLRGGDHELSLPLAAVFAVIAGIFFILSWYFSHQYGISFVELSEARHLPRIIRRAPYFCVATLTTSIVTFAYLMLRNWASSEEKLP